MKVKDTIDIHHFKVEQADLNHLGILFGGKLLAKIDSSLAGSVKKMTNERAVTGSVDKVRFIKALALGEEVTIKSMVSGHSDRVIEVLGLIYNGEHELAAYAMLTFVVLNKQVKLPELVPETEFEANLIAGFLKRAELSQALHNEIKTELTTRDERDI